jgi:Rps23 Pro-64 3,4-dihydroxylase Tpa1-like proline 4-hydroxylase
MGSSGPQSGWVEFGTPPERFLVTTPPDTRAIEPRAGRLVLFPSYFYHRTLPFDSRQRRISIAFDVMPQGRMRRPERL